MNKIKIGNRTIGYLEPVYIIAEMSANHAGSLSHAKEIVHAAKEAGADCIKLQTYTADTITIDSKNDFFTLKSGIWKGQNLYELYKEAHMPWEWQAELFELAEKLSIDMISTPFDKTAVDFLEGIGVKAYKISSFELIDIPLLKYAASKNKPMILSTGMAMLSEIEEAYEHIKAAGNEQTVFLKCVSAYPASVGEMNLSTISDLKERFQLPCGLSDHSMGSLASVLAVALGACVIEKHFCLSRDVATPDSSFSMETNEFKEMVGKIREAEGALGMAQYGPLVQEEDNVKNRKSVFVVKDIKAGEVFTEENIRVIRPGYGIKPKYYEELLGRVAKQDIGYGMPLGWDMVDFAFMNLSIHKGME